MTCVSIDQNCSPLWDAIPKLAALHARGFAAAHWIEDVDAAFTEQFVKPGTPPHVAPERVYPNGNSDWGASFFYSNFMGRNAMNPRSLEPWLRAPLATFAKRAGMDVDSLFAQYASSENFQIIAPSHSGDFRHRTLGSLTLRELRDPLMELFAHAWNDTRRAFPSRESVERADAFFKSEENFLNGFFQSNPNAMLTDLYAVWMKRHLPWQEAGLATTELAKGSRALLEMFLRDYKTFAGLYNRAIAETKPGIAPLDIGKGELPFFAVWNNGAGQYRTPLSWQGGALATDGIVFNPNFALDEKWVGRDLWARRTPGNFTLFSSLAARPEVAPYPNAEFEFNLSREQDAPATFAPKALLLVLHARMNGNALALPWQGSLYMPAARRLEELMEMKLGPVLRVRFHFLERMGELETPVRPPEWLAPFVGADVLPASQFITRLRGAQGAARAELEAARSANYDPAPGLAREIESLQRARGEGNSQEKNTELWNRQKALQQERARKLLDRVASLSHLVALDYWDSRGAILPHALALGGEAFYRRVVERAEIFEENDVTRGRGDAEDCK